MPAMLRSAGSNVDPVRDTWAVKYATRLDPESIRRVVARYFDAMQAVLERHGGTVEKFIGDAIMAVFGIPHIHEDDALRPLRAANEIRERLRTLNDEIDYGTPKEL